MIKDSIQILRGCFGGCTFCSITAHEGRIIQSRSEKSILAEIERMTGDPEFKGTVSDIGGPTANMYRMNCTKPEMRAKCRRLSCVHPAICPHAGDRSRPAHPTHASGAQAAGREKSLRGLGHSHGFGAAEREVYRRGRQTSHRRTAEGRARAYRAGRFEADEKAAHRAVRGVLRAVREGVGRGGQGAVHRAVFHRRPSGQRFERDDRPGALSQAARPAGPRRCRISSPARWISPPACITPASIR